MPGSEIRFLRGCSGIAGVDHDQHIDTHRARHIDRQVVGSPPSTSSCPRYSTGANTPGTAMLARIAVVRSPSPMTTAVPVSRLVATARKGVGR